jgi:replicative DNA helicase
VTHDPNLERTILGAYMLDPSLALRSQLEQNHWQADRHRALFELLRSRPWEDGVEIQMYASERPALASDLGGIAYLSQHAEHCTAPAGVARYERELLERHRRRALAQAAAEAQAQSYDGMAALEVVTTLRRTLDEVEATGSDAVSTPVDCAVMVSRELEEEAAGDRLPYIRTGWGEWDRRWVGIPSEGVILLLARSGMGKTSVINSMAVAMAAAGNRVHVHGTETSAGKRARAIIFGMAGVSPRMWGLLVHKRATGEASARDLEDLDGAHVRLLQAADEYGRLPLHLTGSGLSCERVCAEARRQHRNGCACLFVDYVQDFPFSKGIEGKRTSQIVHHSRMIKDLSAELRMPVVQAAQVSGEKEGLPQKGQVVPQMWDAQWASGLHQDAEEVYAINRGDYWHQRLIDISGREPDGFDESRWGELGYIGLTARKRREGALGHMSLEWTAERRWVGPVWRLEPVAQQRAWNETAEDWR